MVVFNNREEKDDDIDISDDVSYLFDFNSYIWIFVGYSNIASRLSSVMRFVELFLLIDGIKKIKFGNRQLLVCFFMMLESVMFVKNMNSYIQQGEYHNKESISSYEYVSIFNEKKYFRFEMLKKNSFCQTRLIKIIRFEIEIAKVEMI